MAGRLLSLCKVFRGRKKKGPAAAPAQQPEELEQFQPLQAGAGRDQTGEQDPPAPGRFRRAAQVLRRFLRLRRTKKSTADAEGTAQPDCRPTELQDTADAEGTAQPDCRPTELQDTADAEGTAQPDCRPTELQDTADAEGTAQPDSRPTELQAKPSVSTGSTECAGSSETEKADVALNEGMAVKNSDTGPTRGMADTDTMPTPTVMHAPTLDLPREITISSQPQVQAMVKNIHERLISHVTVEAGLQSTILTLAEGRPTDVVLSLLRCAPSCDRAAAMMWKTIASSGRAVEKVLPALLCVMEDRPRHGMATSDEDNKDVFALAATLALWVIAQVPQCHDAVTLHSARLFVALLFQVFITTGQMPEDVDNFWRACREEHSLPTSPNSFAVQTMKALLCRLKCDDEVVALERKRVWDTLLCADTHHYAVGLLARELRRGLTPFCTPITICLLKVLVREKPRWDLPALAFLVEVLECLDLKECGRRMLQIMSKHLQSECRERYRLALRGLVVLSKHPKMIDYICRLTQRLVELLGDADGEVVRMSLFVLKNICGDDDIEISKTTAPKLAEALLPLFENDNNDVQLLSIHLFQKVMELVVKKGKKRLKPIVSQSMFSLLIHWHDENRSVAEASHKTLLCVTRFLKRRYLEELLEKEQRMRFAECLVTEDEIREHLRHALPCLEILGKALRQATLGVIGLFGLHTAGRQEELLSGAQ